MIIDRAIERLARVLRSSEGRERVHDAELTLLECLAHQPVWLIEVDLSGVDPEPPEELNERRPIHLVGTRPKDEERGNAIALTECRDVATNVRRDAPARRACFAPEQHLGKVDRS